MSKKTFYAIPGVVAFVLGASEFIALVTMWIVGGGLADVQLPWYIEFYCMAGGILPFLLFPIAMLLSLIYGFWHIPGWRWWDVPAILIVGAVCALIPFKLSDWHYELIELIWRS